MTVTIPRELEAALRHRAEADGLSVDAYVEQLVREDEEWREFAPDLPVENAEIEAAVSRGLEQALRGESHPAEEVFSELRRKHGISR